MRLHAHDSGITSQWLKTNKPTCIINFPALPWELETQYCSVLVDTALCRSAVIMALIMKAEVWKKNGIQVKGNNEEGTEGGAEIRDDNREIKFSHPIIYCFMKIMEFSSHWQKLPVSDVRLVFLEIRRLGKFSPFCFFYTNNVLSHCRVKQLKCLPSYFRGANVAACLSWSCWDTLFTCMSHTHTNTHTHTGPGKHDSITYKVPWLLLHPSKKIIPY